MKRLTYPLLIILLCFLSSPVISGPIGGGIIGLGDTYGPGDEDTIAAAITSTGAAAILDVADSVTGGDNYTHFSTSADDDTVDELMAALDTALGIRCLESVFGDAIGTGLTLDSTTLKTHTSLQSIPSIYCRTY